MKQVNGLGIRYLQPGEVDLVGEHLFRHTRESGTAGPHFLPFDPENLTAPLGVEADALTRAYGSQGWERWLVVSEPGGSISVAGRLMT